MSQWFGLKEVAQLRAVLTKLHDGFFFLLPFPFHFLLSLTRTKVIVGNTDRELFTHYRMNSFFGHRSFVRNRK